MLSKVFSHRGSPAPSPGEASAIDAVVTWVDGADPKHRAKRNRYLADLGRDASLEQHANKDRRFSDNDEIRFCLRSIRNYAPWVRTIWLVTDHQVPPAIHRRRAEQENIHIVDHREIFRGYERLLPTFNSLSIECMVQRIEGLADRFIYLNDDMMLVGPIEPTRFFSSDGKVRLRGRWTAKQAELLRGSRFHIVNKLRGAKLLGYSSEHFFSSAHVIYPLLRPAMEELFEKFKPAFLANAAYRFRNRSSSGQSRLTIIREVHRRGVRRLTGLACRWACGDGHRVILQKTAQSQTEGDHHDDR